MYSLFKSTLVDALNIKNDKRVKHAGTNYGVKSRWPKVTPRWVKKQMVKPLGKKVRIY